MKRYLVVALGFVLIGCRTGIIPDPNNPANAVMTPDSLRERLVSVSNALLERELSGEISKDQYKKLMVQAASDITKDFNAKTIPLSDAWQYAEILRAAQNWKVAEPLLETAVAYAKKSHNEDRRINDTLRLAQVEAMLGNYKKAIQTASETMDAHSVDSAPILPSVYFEIAPTLRDHGVDYELASLLQAAAAKHLETRVNPTTAAGRDFIMARPTHLNNAYRLAAELYEKSGRKDKVQLCLDYAELAKTNIDELTDRVMKAESEATPEISPSVNL